MCSCGCSCVPFLDIPGLLLRSPWPWIKSVCCTHTCCLVYSSTLSAVPQIQYLLTHNFWTSVSQLCYITTICREFLDFHLPAFLPLLLDCILLHICYIPAFCHLFHTLITCTTPVLFVPAVYWFHYCPVFVTSLLNYLCFLHLGVLVFPGELRLTGLLITHPANVSCSYDQIVFYLQVISKPSMQD